MVAAIAGAANPASALNSKTRRASCRACTPPAHRRMKYSAATASSVLPAAMNSDATTATAGVAAAIVVTLAMNAPMNTPGHMPRPKRSSAAIAIPVGGQTDVALAWIRASVRPAHAAMA